MKKIVLSMITVSLFILTLAGVYCVAEAGDMMDKGKMMMEKNGGTTSEDMMEKGKMMMQDADSAEKGMSLFNDPKAFNGSGDMSCSSCHPGGKGLEKAGVAGKTEWKTPVAVLTSLEDAINVCIMMANKGKAIDPTSEEMNNVISYIKSLGKGESMGMGMDKEMGHSKSDMMEKMKKKAPGY